MKLKLDENIGTRGIELLVQAGHDVTTVAEQNLVSASDPSLIQRCRSEQRAIVTLDLDFSNPLIFDPSEYPRISVLAGRRIETSWTQSELSLELSNATHYQGSCGS